MSQLIERVTSSSRRLQAKDYDALRRRAGHLPPDQELFFNLLLDGKTHRQVGRMFDLPPGTVCRRFRTLCRRLNHPLVAAILDHPRALSPRDRKMALGHILGRKSLATLAAEHGMSQKKVRAILHFLYGWAQGRVKEVG